MVLDRSLFVLGLHVLGSLHLFLVLFGWLAFFFSFLEFFWFCWAGRASLVLQDFFCFLGPAHESGYHGNKSHIGWMC
jgi:hypothetical protein